MKRVICALLTAVILFSSAWTAAEDMQPPAKEYFMQAAQAQYPGWTLWETERFAAGNEDGGWSHYIEFKLYRIDGHHVELKELLTRTDTLREGDEIAWEETAYVPVEIVPGKEEALMAMEPETIFSDGSGACFSDQALEMLSPNMLGEGESLYQLMACREHLIATAKNHAGGCFLRIAQWDGHTYSIVSTPEQEPLCFNRIHSWDDSVEIYFGEGMEGTITRGEDGSWRLNTINSGYEILAIEPEYIVDISYGGYEQYNDHTHYGRIPFETDMSKIRLSDIPTNLQDMMESMDRTLTVCTAQDDTPLYTRPDGEVMALCYTRVPGVIVSQTDGWIQMQIGQAAFGLRAWVKAEDLAFGEQTETVRCTFPSYDEFYKDEDEPVEGTAPDGSTVQLDCARYTPRLIGKTPDGSWLVLLDGKGSEKGMVCTVPEQAFRNVRPTEREEWDEEALYE